MNIAVGACIGIFFLIVGYCLGFATKITDISKLEKDVEYIESIYDGCSSRNLELILENQHLTTLGVNLCNISFKDKSKFVNCLDCVFDKQCMSEVK